MLSKINFSLTQLEYVLAVHRHGHFAKAAEASNVTQPTLSMQIQKLEEDLGIVIFDRSKKPILLTDVGKKLIEQIQTVLFEAKKIGNIVETEQKGVEHGELSFAVIPTIAPYLLPRLLPVLEKQARELSLKILELQTGQILEALHNDEIDVGILAIPLGDEKIFEEPLYYEPFSLLCRKDHEYATLKKVAYQDLKMGDIWLLEEGHCLRNQVLDLCSSKKGKSSGVRKYQFESGNLETLKNLVDLYSGYTLLPQLATEHVGSQSKIISFEKPQPAREVGLVYRRAHYKKRLIEILADSIQKSLPADIKKIRPKDLNVLPVE